jgi:hypothetical protein
MSGEVKIENGNLVFEIHGIDEILSIKRSISIPIKKIVSVSTERVPWEPFRQLRVAGTSLPGVIKEGRFLSSDGLMFFEMKDPDKCITVTLDHEHYKKIVFEVNDKESTAKMISEEIKKRK